MQVNRLDHYLRYSVKINSNPAAVANVLSRCAAPVRSFDIRVRLRHCARAAYWLRTLAGKRVRALTLSFDYSSRGEFPGVGRAIFSCEEFTRLGLYHCEVPRAPHVFEGFPDLTKLVLAQINLPFNGGGALLQRLIAAGPNLAVLCLYDVSIDAPNGGNGDSERWAIRAPNLRILKLDMTVDNGCRIGEELPLLEEADISIDCLLGTQDFLDTFRRIASVKVLKFESNDALFAENPLEGISWKFWNLRRSALSANFSKISSILSIFSLLRCAPHIEKLDIEVDVRETLVDEIDEGFLNAETSDDLFTTLKHVSLNDIKCFSNEMCFIKLLLSKTSSLESFEVSAFSASLMSCEEACAELATYRKASSLAKVEVTHNKKPALMMDAYF